MIKTKFEELKEKKVELTEKLLIIDKAIAVLEANPELVVVINAL